LSLSIGLKHTCHGSGQIVVGALGLGDQVIELR
jgi:hypothetical protein